MCWRLSAEWNVYTSEGGIKADLENCIVSSFLVCAAHQNDQNVSRKEDGIDGLCRMQHAYGMRKISKILIRELCGIRLCVGAVDGLIKNWDVVCGLHQ